VQPCLVTCAILVQYPTLAGVSHLFVETAGIDALAFHGPRYYLDLADLAVARGVEPAKYANGLGQSAMAVPTPCEDTVSLAIGAGRKVLENFGVDRSEIGTLAIGTETGIDHSKPVASYVHEHLGLPSNCRCVETKHACLGASAGLVAAMDWIASGRARGRKALVIAADIARYGLDTPGEPTQGAGAVAFVVSEKPRLLEVDPDVYGDYTRQVMDFWRPLYSKHAFVDGRYSIDCYLEALASTWVDAADKPNAASRMPIAGLDACFYHVPFVKMAQKAHHRHWEAEAGHEAGNGKRSLAAQIDASFEQRVRPWLSLNAAVGNIYTGSMYLALIDYLRSLEVAREGKRVSLFSYGSGCGASLLFGRVAGGAAAYRHRLDPQPDLDRRHRLDFARYEEIMLLGEGVDINNGLPLDPSAWGLGPGVYFLGIQDHMRQYGSPRTSRPVARQQDQEALGVR
jgi:hydroxymethylglutaryl-CoA synthase